MKKLTGLFSLAVLVALFTSGCATMTHGPNQRVVITSWPQGATVIDNGEEIGETPLVAWLSRKTAHEITLEKEGYAPEEATLLTVPNAPSKAFIQFDIDRTIGAHSNLEPGAIHVELDPLMIPEEPAEDPVAELGAKVVELDERLANGEITQEEYDYLLSRLLQYYNE